ncbi:MAG: glutamyl-tRNA reductase [Acidobacteria bacterium]|nr:MAG: glutamyl-tRNA reductase [Acidobacteriota bacterium]
MKLVLVGVNHRTAPVEVRERLAFPEDRLPEALSALKQDFGCEEALILSTCNRVELLAHPRDGCLRTDRLIDFLYDFHHLQPPCLQPYLYTLSERDTVRHVFRVASSLDSMVIGEPQILGQMKRAYTLASTAGSSGLLLNSLMHRAFHVAKRVRTETRISNSAVSVSYVAVELARKILGELSDRTILIVGAGKMSELAARHLLKSGISKTFVTNRTPAKAEEMAERFDGVALPFEGLLSHLALPDIAIVSTAAEGYVLRKPDMQRVVRERRHRPLFLIDISVPRNIDPAINDIEEVFLYDIDDMQSVIQANLEERRKEAEPAEAIIAEEVDAYVRRAATRQAGSLISALRDRLESICLSELEKNRTALTPDEYARAERMLRTTAHRLAHPFIQQLKNPDGNLNRYQHEVDLIKRVFQLEEEE